MAYKSEVSFRFDRMELAGSLGDLGTLLPLTIGMIVLNEMRAINVLLTFGAFYLLSGLYFRVPVAVQPMKVIAAYAVSTGMNPQQISAAGLWMGVLVLLFGVTGFVEVIRRYTPKSTIRGIQLAVGLALLLKGLELIAQTDSRLIIGGIGPLNMGLFLAIVGGALTLLLAESTRFPAALVLIGFGVVVGLALGRPLAGEDIAWSLHLPHILPYGLPGWNDLVWAVPAVVLPQLPMTIGNAIISNTDLTHEYFAGRAQRVTNSSVATSQGLANILSFFLGGIPMCHGAGGLAAHYRFGARTAGSNCYIGGILLVLALLFGDQLVWVLRVLPSSILGLLLTFAGLELALMIQDLKDRKELFVALFMLGLALAFNLGVAFIGGIAVAQLVKSAKIKI